MNRKLVFAVALCVAGASGFLSLSFEIIWFRAYSYITGGAAPSFGVVLGVFLVGVAFGSAWARNQCKDAAATGKTESLAIPALLLIVGSAGGFAVVPIAAWACVLTDWYWSLPAVALVAGILGAILPLVAHFGIAPDERAGERLSFLYLANILGSAAGSLITGFVLLDQMTPSCRVCHTTFFRPTRRSRNDWIRLSEKIPNRSRNS